MIRVRPGPCKLPHEMALVTCPGALRLRRLAHHDDNNRHRHHHHHHSIIIIIIAIVINIIIHVALIPSTVSTVFGVSGRDHFVFVLFDVLFWALTQIHTGISGISFDERPWDVNRIC